MWTSVDTQGELMKRVAALLIVAELVFASGGVAIAQTTTDPVDPTPPPVEEVTAPIVIPTDDGSSTDLQGASSTPQLQETLNEQDTTPPEEVPPEEDVTLATSTDPEVGTSTDPIIPGGSGDTPPPPPDATTTTDEIPPSDVPPADVPPVEPTPPQEEPQPEPPPPPPPPQVEPPQQQNPVVITAEELRPEPKYVFQLSGKKFATTRRVKRTSIVKSKPVETVTSQVEESVPQVSADNTTGVMSVSGVCEDKYYIILIYRRPNDYAENPGTYVVNRAFPCEGGTFSYSVTDMPPTLPDGNYYILVGSQGDGGGWTPITGVTEVTLHRNF